MVSTSSSRAPGGPRPTCPLPSATRGPGCGSSFGSVLIFKNHENTWSGPHGGRTLWPSARMRPHNDGMAGSLVAVRDAIRNAARTAAADAAAPAGTAAAEGAEGTGTGRNRDGAAADGVRAERQLRSDPRPGRHQPERPQWRARRPGGRERRGQDQPGALHRRCRGSGERRDLPRRQAHSGGSGWRGQAGSRRGLAGPGAVRQPGHRVQHPARQGIAAAPAVRHALSRGRRVADRRAAYPAEGHHPQRPLAVRWAAAAGGGGAGDGQQAATAGPRRADRLAGR